MFFFINKNTHENVFGGAGGGGDAVEVILKIE